MEGLKYMLRNPVIQEQIELIGDDADLIATKFSTTPLFHHIMENIDTYVTDDIEQTRENIKLEALNFTLRFIQHATGELQ